MITQIIITLGLGLIVGFLFGWTTEDFEIGAMGFFTGGIVGLFLSLCIAFCIPANTTSQTTTNNIIPLSQIIEIEDNNKYIICDKDDDNTLIYTLYIKNKKGYPEKIVLDNPEVIASKTDHKYIETKHEMVSLWCWGYDVEKDKYQIIAPENSIYYTFVKE